MKPVLFVTGHAPFDRVGAFARLSEREDVEFALFGGRSLHGPAHDTELATSDTPGDTALPAGDTADDTTLSAGDTAGDTALPFPHRHVEQRQIGRLAASGRYRAVVCSTGGRLALPAAWAGARRARVPLILWTSLWAHPRSAAHLFSYPALARLYRSADAVVTYGPHVSAYVRARGARNVHCAPQSVDNAFWSGASGLASAWPAEAGVKFLFAGRPTREKGLGVLIEAWSNSGLAVPSAALVLVGVGSAPPWIPAGGAVRAAGGAVLQRLPVEPPLSGSARLADPGRRSPAVAGAPIWLNPVTPDRLRELYAAADVLLVPSIATRTFREPWGLVVNEAMNRKLPVIASDAVGAAAGGLVRDGRNGLIVPAGDSGALAGAIGRLAADAPLRARLGAAGAADVRAYTHDAWAGGFADALASLGLSREGRW
jgi:glycosyltransferase involved in cell wall biosynthesis